jgi:SAM-dependent methyltransferase
MAKLYKVPCPLCRFEGDFAPVWSPDESEAGQKTFSELYDGRKKSEWKICSRCGFVHLNPRPSQSDIDVFYNNAQYHRVRNPEPSEYIHFAKWYYGDKVRYAIRKSGYRSARVFDFGFGYGGVLKIFKDAGWQTSGIEPDAPLVEFAKNSLGIESIQSGTLGPNVQVEAQADLVFSNHVFEHAGDLDSVMQGVKKVLKPGGLMFTVVPTFYKNRSFTSKGALSFGHCSAFTHRSFGQLLARHGFEIVDYTYRGSLIEVDDLWVLARNSEKTMQPELFYENSRWIKFYLDVLSPIRSTLYYPFFSHYPQRVAFFNRTRHRLMLLLTSPREFYAKARRYFST